MQQEDLFFDVTHVKERKPYLRSTIKLLSSGIDHSSRLLPRRGQRLQKILLLGVMDSVYEPCWKHCLHGLCPVNCSTRTALHLYKMWYKKYITFGSLGARLELHFLSIWLPLGSILAPFWSSLASIWPPSASPWALWGPFGRLGVPKKILRAKSWFVGPSLGSNCRAIFG